MPVAVLLLRLPPPLAIDQVPVVAPPPILEELRAKAVGVALWHTTSGPPAETIGFAFTLIVLVALTAEHPPGALLVN